MMRVLRAVRRSSLALLLATLAGTLYGQVVLYVPTESSNEVWEYGVTSATGNLTSFPTQSVTGNQPNIVAVTPNNRYMYAGNGTGNITGYVVGYDGTLTQIPPPFAAAGSVRGIAIDSSGRYLYAGNNTGNQIVMFRINQSTGALDYANPVIISTGASTRPRGVTADNAGHLYVALQQASQILSFQINGDGSLTSLGSLATGASPDRVAVVNHSSGTYVYTTNFIGNSISIFNQQANGSLVFNSTVTTSSTRPIGIIPDNNSRFLIVTFSTTTNLTNVIVYQVQNGGGLTPVFSTPSEAGAGLAGSLPTGVTLDPSNRYLYVANSASASVSKFNFDATTGALSVPGNFATGTTPQFLLSRPLPIAPSVPAASPWSLLGLGLLLAGSSAVLYRRSQRARLS